jgi:hypothetical protein
LKSPVRENRTPGSVQGASGNRRSYCDCKKNELWFFLKTGAMWFIKLRVLINQKAKRSQLKTEN